MRFTMCHSRQDEVSAAREIANMVNRYLENLQPDYTRRHMKGHLVAMGLVNGDKSKSLLSFELGKISLTENKSLRRSISPMSAKGPGSAQRSPFFPKEAPNELWEI